MLFKRGSKKGARVWWVAAVRIKPDLGFGMREPTDGLGYVHQPFDAVVYITLVAGIARVVSFVLQKDDMAHWQTGHTSM